METFPDQRHADLSDSGTDPEASGQDDLSASEPLLPEHRLLAAAWQLVAVGDPDAADRDPQQLLDQLNTRPAGAGPAADALTLLAGLRQVEKLVEELAETAAGAYGAADPDATYVELGRAWGVTRQTARAKWPGAVLPKPTVSRTISLRGGTAVLEQVRGTEDWTWLATGADGLRGTGRTPSPSYEEALAAGIDWLRDHAVQPAPGDR
jgi:hypothetical protein